MVSFLSMIVYHMNCLGRSKLLNSPYLGKKCIETSKLWMCLDDRGFHTLFYSLCIHTIAIMLTVTTQQFCSIWQVQCFSSDGRVTSSTTKLIQTLLVLDPKKRLTASQVLSVLSETMRKWWVLIIFSKPVLPKTTSTRKYFSFIQGPLLLEK
jgi:hypothetical protein